MADTKVTDLTPFTPVLADMVYGVDDPAGSPVSGNFTLANLLTLFEAEIEISSSQVTGLGSYITASSTDTLTNKTINTASNTITIVEADISDLGSYLTSVAINDITDVTISAPADNEVLAYNNGTGTWINQTAAEAGLAAASHSHTLSDISDSGAAAALGVTGADANAVTGTAGTSGDLATWNVDGDLVDGPTPPSGAIVGTTDSQTLTNKNLADATNTYRAASTTVTGAVELADVSETSAGTDTGRAVTPDGLAGSVYGTEVVTVCLFDDSEDVATGDGAGDQLLRIPSKLNGWDLVAVAAYVQTAGTTGTTDIQIHNVTDAVDMLSTKITIDSTETDSSTAAAAAVINTAADDVATGDKIRFDVDAVSTTPPKGLWVELQFRAP